ncbi:MAG TPA: MBL fold metallo-hydrolase [Deltaproteobacteria bacterium]|nr:MBL fold metallo-hydrolase [Deltaproteobacteria bacterium]
MKSGAVFAVPPAGYANTWLVEDEGNFMAVDVGTSRAADNFHSFMKHHLKISPERLSLITATHFHCDHVGGVERLTRLCPEAQVRFARLVERYISGEEKLAVPPPERWMIGLTAIILRMPRVLKGTLYSLRSSRVGMPVPLLRGLNRVSFEALCDLDETTVLEGFPHWRVVETPGHTPDSICLYNEAEGILISGDTILNMRGRGELNSFCCSPDDIRRSYEKLLGLRIESVYPGHGTPIEGMPGVLRNVRRDRL